MQRIGSIKMDRSSDETSDLRCPRCGSMYLHQGRVEIFARGEDADKLTHVVVAANATASVSVIDSDLSANPSSRRHGMTNGMTISFDCEECSSNDADDVIEMTIAQHKGCTGWRFTPRKPRRDDDL